MKLKIEGTNYVIDSDSFGWSIGREEITKTGPNVGKVTIKNFGYASSISGLIDLLGEHQIRTTEAETLEEAVQEVRDLAKKIKQTFSSLLPSVSTPST